MSTAISADLRQANATSGPTDRSRATRFGAIVFIWCLFSEAIFFSVAGATGHPYSPGGTSYRAYNALLDVSIVALMIRSGQGAKKSSFSKTKGKLALLCLIVLCSILVNEIRFPDSASMPLVLQYFASLTFPAVLVVLATSRAQLEIVARWLPYFTSVLAVIVMIAAWRSGILQAPSGYEYFSNLGGASHLTVGTSMGATAVIHLAAASRDRGVLRQLWHWAAITAAVYLLLISGSRGALVGVAFVVVVWVFWGRSRVPAPLRLGILVTGAYYVIHWVSASANAGLEKFRNFSPAADASSGVRLDFMGQAASNFRDHPMLGDGVGSFSQVIGTYGYPHNLFFEIANDFGVIGLAVLIALCVLSTRTAISLFQGGALDSVIMAALALLALVELQFSGSYVAFPAVWMTVGSLFLVARPKYDAAPRAD